MATPDSRLPAHGSRPLTMAVPKNERPLAPESWEQVAELRVFRANPTHWERLIKWRKDMRRKGWKLLRVSTSSGVLVAIFGRTRAELLARGNKS